MQTKTPLRAPGLIHPSPRPSRLWQWSVVVFAAIVATFAIVTGWGTVLLALLAAITAFVGFYARRRRWWGLAASAAGVVVLIGVFSELRLVTDAEVALVVFFVLALAWLGVRRRALLAPGGPLTRDRRGLFGPRPMPTPGWRALLIIPLIVVFLPAVALMGAMSTPGNQNLQAKWADWLRSHHAVGAANDLEKFYYTHNAPARGGQLAHLNVVPKAHVTPAPAIAAPQYLPPPTAVPLLVSPGLPGEGQWAPTGPLVHGSAGLYVAQFRADDVYTSQITSAVWIDPKIVHVALIPGSQEPGGTWTQPPYIPVSEEPDAVAAFNGGFRMADAQGGFYLDGQEQVALRDGAASVVIYKDGHIDIGRWGTEVTMTPDVTAVLQNLVLIVDSGQMSSDATYNDTKVWGTTVGTNTVVPRSGIGITADGALIYVAGPALTAKSLGESLLRAGAVRAMTLDINPEWVTFNFFEPDSSTGGEDASKLYPEMERPATRYLAPTHESRDFFALTITPTTTASTTSTTPTGSSTAPATSTPPGSASATSVPSSSA